MTEWKIEADSDYGWTVTDGQMKFKSYSEHDATWLLRLLRTTSQYLQWQQDEIDRCPRTGFKKDGEGIRNAAAIAVWFIILIFAFVWLMACEAFSRRPQGTHPLRMPRGAGWGLK